MPLPTTIVCPDCGYDGTTEPKHGKAAFYYLEDIVSYRYVKGIDEHGVLVIHGLYQSGEGYDEGSDARLECKNCLEEFPMPRGVEIDFE